MGAVGKRIWLVYLGGFLLAVHYASIAYVNSSLLKQFISNSKIGLFYILGSISSIAMLSLAPLLLRKWGNIATLLFFILLEVIAVFGMGSGSLSLLIFFLFLLHQAAESMLYFSLDVSLENEIRIEGETGGKRGAFLTIQNIAWVLSPLAMSLLITNNDFSNVYFLSGIALIPLALIALAFFRKVENGVVPTSHIFLALKSLRSNWDEVRIIGTQFVLQFYFSWMIIYLPLTLNKEVGFSWEQIGVMFTIMLIPYLIFELPAGLLADRKIGEKEILITGFLLMAVTTFVIPFLTLPIFGLWSVILFITRIGASMVEISSESYFFKHVRAEDTGLISLFHMARPLSFVLAPLIAIPTLFFTSYSGSFLVLSLLTLFGLLFIPKKDTK